MGDSKSNGSANPLEEYRDFEEKVKRTVYIDNLTPSVTVPILKKALEQFGTVIDAQILPNYLEDKNAAVSALVEMEDDKDATNTVNELGVNAFMIAGAPRPVRAKHATISMFPDHPAPPRRKLTCYWVNPGDPDWESVSKVRDQSMKHIAQALCLLQYQREEEEKLGEQQEETLRSNYRKYELLDNLGDGTLERLAQRYKMRGPTM
eukprot:TRINITY_DN2925_c0_g1_i1.p1 TRINITY_DN2925_c0_g1~~TRINITY_DN2925_c0_g1_i1.p1  ORF type:complete len:206 (-),score=55.78 TRINITY_DN2925_c0_g1_i1:227-844(-)